MNLFGDLERFFATVIWPNRVPLLVATIALGTVVFILAWRAGWIARVATTARRHPGRSALAAGLALALVVPLGWYLASPLFLRTELVEDLPIAVAAPSSSPAPGGTPTASPTPTNDAGPTVDPSQAPSSGPLVVASGSFQDADDFHRGSGEARIVEIAPGRYVLRFEGFSVTNGPDLHVYVSPDPDGYAAGSLDLGKLKATDGSFNHELPDGFEPASWASVVIWCEPFAVQFAHAPLGGA
jgi:hypothetical protein